MLKHGRSGVVLALVLALSARVGLAQDTSKDDEIQDLKRRLEALEQKQQSVDSAVPGAAVIADPVDEKWYDKVHVGGGVRTEYRANEEFVGGVRKWTSDFNLDNARLYTGGKINDVFSVTLDAEFAAAPSVLDAICEAKISDSFHIWMGRMLPATDRSNSDGPFYISAWDFPFLSDGFNSATVDGIADRDNGVTFWGDIQNFKYWAGVYEGQDHGAPSVAIPKGDRLMYAARAQYNFMDPEPGYYLQSTYYGEKKILALGAAANYQNGAVATTAGNVKPMGNVEVDVLWEQKMAALADGTATVEVAYYYFGRHGIRATATSGVSGIDVGAGDGLLFTVCYLIPGRVGWGEFQPFFRYQGFDHSPSSRNNPGGVDHSDYDIGVNYVMMGHNARISLVYTHIDEGPAQFGQVVVGTQFQF